VTPSGKRLQLRWDEFERLADRKGWKTNKARAQNLGVSAGHLTNLRKKRDGVGGKFIAGCIAAWGAPIYDVLFEDVESPAEPAPGGSEDL